MSSEIRTGQLIAPFSPGSIYTDKNGVPNIICGLDFWYKEKDNNGNFRLVDKALQAYTIEEPRLSELLQIPIFRLPPQHIRRQKENTNELAGLSIQTHRFPTWYYDNRSGKLKRFSLESLKCESRNNEQWRPVRFISVCANGHISDFPWKDWCKCTCEGEEGLKLHDTGGPDLSSVWVSCEICNKSKPLSGAMFLHRDEKSGEIDDSGLLRAGFSNCKGEQPWLGSSSVSCKAVPVAVLINQSNIYFGKTISSIYLPNLSVDNQILEIQKVLESGDIDLTFARFAKQMGNSKKVIEDLKNEVGPYFSSMPSDSALLTAFETLGRGDLVSSSEYTPQFEESKELSFRRAEYNVLKNPVPLKKSDELRILRGSVPEPFAGWLRKINLVERLRETRVFYGFDRLSRPRNPILGMPHTAMHQLFRNPPDSDLRWLPAVKNYGEGIFLELQEEAIRIWLQQNSSALIPRLDQQFCDRVFEQGFLLPPLSHENRTWEWAARYLLVHTLAHILINQMVFECGYSSAALKERLFVSNDTKAPMAALLIYTASGDSEGSLGGLVRLGRPELFESLVLRALSKASWCSADPVCSEDMGGTGSQLINKAACHACVLLPETACETINSGLDRAMVVGTPTNRDIGFLSEFLDS